MAIEPIKQGYTGASELIVITLGGLIEGNARESLKINNEAASGKHLDALVQLSIKLQAGAPSGDKAAIIYAYGSEQDGGVTLTDNATGVDASIILRDPTNLRWIGTINTPDAGALTYHSHPMGIAKAFDGPMPSFWGIVVENRTGVTFDTVEANHRKAFRGIFAEVGTA